MLSEQDALHLGFDQQDIENICQWKMPFGKYQARRLIDLPEAYLFWFRERGFPEGELGKLLSLTLEIKVAGLDAWLKAVCFSGVDEARSVK